MKEKKTAVACSADKEVAAEGEVEVVGRASSGGQA